MGAIIGKLADSASIEVLHAPIAGTQDIISQDGTRRILRYVPSPKDKTGLYVSVVLSYEQIYKPLQNSALISIAIALLGTVVSMLGAWFTATRVISRPVQIMTNSIARWQNGETNIRTGFSADSGELAGLGQALDKLMDDVEAYRHIRELLMHELAHRMKNTLANVIGIAAQSFSRIPSAQKALIDSTDELSRSAKRM
jgi:signal transduction histidine kinase